MLAHVAELYAIEDEIGASPPQQRVFVRSARAKPVLGRIKTQLEAWANDPQVLPKSGIGRAVAYTRKLWPGLESYLTIGAANIDNDHTERSMRPVAMHRKNSLFSASDAGAQGYATLLPLAFSAHAHALDPVAYLCDIIDDIHYQRRPLHDLTPTANARRKGKKSQKPSKTAYSKRSSWSMMMGAEKR
jgi:transposase